MTGASEKVGTTCGQHPKQAWRHRDRRRILTGVPAEDDGPRDAAGAADATWADAAAPDDLSELARDVAAYHRELRRARRNRRIQRLLRHRGTVPLLVMGGATMLAGLIAVMLTLAAPGTVERAPTALPLAHPTAADGSVHGLLPAVSLTGPNGTIGARAAELRPAVFALVPTNCGCGNLLDSLAGQAYSEVLPLAIVVPAASDPTTAHVVASLSRGSPGLYYDPAGALAAAVNAEGVTLVVVNRDGTIYDIERSVTDPSASSLDATLQSMLLPTRSHG
jgi:hypothetical protein